MRLSFPLLLAILSSGILARPQYGSDAENNTPGPSYFRADHCANADRMPLVDLNRPRGQNIIFIQDTACCPPRTYCAYDESQDWTKPNSRAGISCVPQGQGAPGAHTGSNRSQCYPLADADTPPP